MARLPPLIGVARFEVDAAGRITSVEPSDEPIEQGALLPGFVDLQCNGWDGTDLADATPEAFRRVGEALLASGTTAWCPTLPSAPSDTYPRFLEQVADPPRGPRVLGAHLEGPFLNPRYAGAHPPDLLRPADPAWLAETLDRVPGLVRIVTLAPELPGALECIEVCVSRDVKVALGHTDADAESTARAIAAGATLLTHLFNGMRPLHHRDVGVIGAALADERVRCTLICDGEHVDGGLAAFVARGLGPHRCAAVSDAVARTGRDPLRGGYTLLDGSLANLVSWGIPLADAVRIVSTTPADTIDATDVGRLEPGAYADAVLWRDGRVVRTCLGDEPV